MLKSFIIDLYKYNIIKYGNFVLKSGQESNIYFNLRELIAYPYLLKTLCNLIYPEFPNTIGHSICGLSYTGIPIASYLSIKYNIPMLIVRKERKTYGTKQLIEGVYKEGDKCILIDDLITTGTSMEENINILRSEGIEIDNVVVFINRTSSDSVLQKFENNMNVKLKYVINMYDVIRYIEEYKNDAKIYANVNADKLMRLIDDKKTGLCFSADLEDPYKILDVVDKIGKYICMLKLHIDIINFDNMSIDDFIIKLNKLKYLHNFYIMEDHKFSDIGNTVKNQLFSNTFKIHEWADYITVHSIMGYGTLESIKDYKGGVFLLAQASSDNNLIDDRYTKSTIDMATKYDNMVVGFISQENLGLSQFIYAKPGINLELKNDVIGQKYTNNNNNCNIIIVGRGIYNSNDIIKSAIEYMNISYSK